MYRTRNLLLPLGTISLDFSFYSLPCPWSLTAKPPADTSRSTYQISTVGVSEIAPSCGRPPPDSSKGCYPPRSWPPDLTLRLRLRALFRTISPASWRVNSGGSSAFFPGYLPKLIRLSRGAPIWMALHRIAAAAAVDISSGGTERRRGRGSSFSRNPLPHFHFLQERL